MRVAYTAQPASFRPINTSAGHRDELISSNTSNLTRTWTPTRGLRGRGIRREWCVTWASSAFDSSKTRLSSRDVSISREIGRVQERTAAILTNDPAVEVEGPVQSVHELTKHISRLIFEMRTVESYADKLGLLLARNNIQEFLRTGIGRQVFSVVSSLEPRQGYCLLCLIEIGQKHVLSGLNHRIDGETFTASLNKLANSLERVEEFYDSIGGVAGYQLQCLKIIDSSEREEGDIILQRNVEMLVPQGLDIRSTEAKDSVLKGMEAIQRMAEIYPLGGAGDRLGLQCEETGDSLPTAVLPYCGRSLLEHLIRDVQAREYLHYCVHGKQWTTPIAVMTSLAKGNHKRVEQLFEANHWFGRGAEAFKLFQQPMVPMVTATDGKWTLSGPCKVIMKPGGHGVIWKLMLDNGIFDWLKDQNRDAAIVRQISNPMAGQDRTLLALSGHGVEGNKAFGFASCERVVGAAEGMNVALKETITSKDGTIKTTCRITNVEYTEFTKLGIEDKGVNGSSYSLFPANTNVLYLGLEHVESMVRESVRAGTTEAILPGMILNLNKEIVHVNVDTGTEESIQAGRLECTMQNLADTFAKGIDVEDEICANLPTFLVYGPRRKVTSSAKRKRKPGSLKIHQTPDGSFYDLQQNAKEMMELCGMDMPEVGSVDEYLEKGPGFIFLFHPALGPLWEVVAQKINGGKMHEKSEIQLEIAEASITNVEVDGSLVVTSDSIMGQLVDGKLMYDREQCGRILLENVKVENSGIDYDNPHNVFWRHRVSRKEMCCIHLQGRSEFEAQDVTLSGNKEYIVPDGHRMIVRSGTNGEPCVELVPLGNSPSWIHVYSRIGQDINLEMRVN